LGGCGGSESVQRVLDAQAGCSDTKVPPPAGWRERKSATAALIASSARMDQWIFTGGSASSSEMSEFLIASASSSVRPRTHSVTSELDAIAEPQP